MYIEGGNPNIFLKLKNSEGGFTQLAVKLYHTATVT